MGRDRHHQIHSLVAGCCVGSRPWRFLQATRCFENLSSGEKRAVKSKSSRGSAPQAVLQAQDVFAPGWAEKVGAPSGVVFCEARATEAEV